MRKLVYLFALLFIGANIASCTPEAIIEEITEEACCDGNGEIDPPLPPPPPPPPEYDDTGN